MSAADERAEQLKRDLRGIVRDWRDLPARKRPMYWALDEDGEPYPVHGVREWAGAFEPTYGQRVVGDDLAWGFVRVSTVFLGIDHGFGRGAPVLFETMTFGGPFDGDQDRYHTRAEAVAGHRRTLVRAWLSVPVWPLVSAELWVRGKLRLREWKRQRKNVTKEAGQ